MNRSLRIALLAVLGSVLLGVVVVIGGGAAMLASIAWNARSGEPMIVGSPTTARRPPASTKLASAAAEGGDRQILFGDLHVHTSYSADSMLQGISIASREPGRGPADACDFARFCSQLDFWSINDHAESLTPAHWRATVDSIRECNARAGDPADPDLVSFLGWEWTHQTLTPEDHWGHKNVVLLGTEDDEIPTRPIAALAGPPYMFLLIGAVGSWLPGTDFSDFATFHRYTLETFEVDECAADAAVRDLPPDCRESATTPERLFEKLDDWGLPAIVIPHGLSWGVTNPANARLEVQLGMHDPERQRLLEVYSGHGNSEVYRDFVRPTRGEDGRWDCPTASPGVEFCCQRAERLARERCDDPASRACDSEVEAAVQAAAGADSGLSAPTSAIEGTTDADWGDCSQLAAGEFLPSFKYRPRQSAQYALALGGTDTKGDPQRFRWGFIGSSDTHRGRGGTGYKEFARQIMSDGVDYPLPSGLMDSRDGSFYYTGGLAAVHSPRRDRQSIFDALDRRQTYGTSGDRILLWFDLLDAEGREHPMGSEVESQGLPRFRVRALGAQRQNPGCPEFVHAALTPERIASLCLGECHHPGEERKRISRIEVVRIRPQQQGSEAIASRIEDPWKVIECAPDPAGCSGEFDDPDYAKSPAETAYYVRAIQEPSDAVNGDPLSCERDAKGACLQAHPCGTGADGLPDDCLAAVGERAWSSPIFVQPLRSATR